MRIFISSASRCFTDYKPHGEGLICWNIAARLARRGHEVVVATAKAELRTAVPGMDVRIIPVKTPFSLMQDWEIARRTQRLYERLHAQKPFDVVHHILPFGSKEAFSIRPGRKTPLILGPLLPEWQNQGQAIRPLKAFVRWLPARYARSRHRQTLKRAACIMVPLTIQPGYFGAIGRPTRTVALGVDTTRFKPADQAGAFRGTTILFLANLEARKGILDLVEAFGQLAARYPQARLVIAGDGSQRPAVEHAIAQKKLSQQIVLLGAISNEATPQHYQQADIYCLPSLGEPFGITILEAMACGKPIVTTNIGGPAEIVVAGRSGMLVPPGDIAALAAALDHLLSHPAEREAMGAFNRQRVLQHYDWERIVDSIAAIYSEAAAGS